MADTGHFMGLSDPQEEPLPSEATGRLISLRFISSALRRRRRFWVTLAVIGLVLGAGYHTYLAKTSTATATLYLAHAPGGNDEIESANDVSMVRTLEVGQKAAALLGEPNLAPFSLLGKAPAKAASANVLVLSISGPSPAAAVKRVNAVASAYLAFRSDQYNLQNQAIVKATNDEISKFQSQIDQLTATINGLSPSQSAQLSSLISERSTLQTQVTGLQQTVQTDNIDTLSVSQGSRVLTAGTLVAPSQKKSLTVDALSGLVGGLALGVIIVVLQAVLSDRLWRREDIAAALGAPVDLSVPKSSRRARRRRSRSAHSGSPSAGDVVGNYLYGHMVKRGGSRRSGLWIAVDDPEPLAVAVAGLAMRLAATDRPVVLVDATNERVLGKFFKVTGVGTHGVHLEDAAELTVVIPPKPWETEDDSRWRYPQGDWSNTSSVLTVATVDPAYGASHLQRWGREAVVTVVAGRSTAQRINTVAELLEVARITVTSAVLFDADADDQSIGQPDPITARPVVRPDVSTGAEVRLP